MIVLTGGAGFIGSCLLKKLNEQGHNDIMVVDSLGHQDKWKNLVQKSFSDYMPKNEFLQCVVQGKLDHKKITHFIHLGACSTTTQTDADYLYENNTRYTGVMAEFCVSKKIPFLYASSAATYGMGENGYDDSIENLHSLKPINMYAFSKHQFDLYAKQKGWFQHITGLKFFNVYGPNENHKTGMTSIVWNCYHKIMAMGAMQLFKSTHPEYADGGQLRDFIYVKDVTHIMFKLVENPAVTGLYNVGTGKATSWVKMTEHVFKALSKKLNVEYIDMPKALLGRYQYYTQAHMNRLLEKIPFDFTPHEDAVFEYVNSYLQKDELL